MGWSAFDGGRAEIWSGAGSVGIGKTGFGLFCPRHPMRVEGDFVSPKPECVREDGPLPCQNSSSDGQEVSLWRVVTLGFIAGAFHTLVK